METMNTERAAEVARTLGAHPSRRGGHLRRWLALVLLALLAGGSLLWWQGRNGEESVKYKTEQARRGRLVVTVTATGNLQPTNQVVVGSELSGIVRVVDVDYNDHVTVGRELARLDTSKLEAQAAQSRAALAAAKAKVLQAEATEREARGDLARLQKVRKLSGNKVPSHQDIDAAAARLQRAQADVESNKATVDQAQATLQANETDLAKAVIRSPINGIVLTRSVEPGQTVAASLQAPVLFTLAEDLTKMELLVDVDEADVGQVASGQEATFTVDAYPQRSFPARVTQVRYGAKTVSGVVTYETVLQVDNSDLSLRPGMTATAEITVQTLDEALLVPNAALRFSPPRERRDTGSSRGLVGMLLPHRPRRNRGREDSEAKGSARRQQIWTLRDGRLRSVPVTLGPTDGSVTAITGGAVEPGMTVVVDTLSTRG